MGTGGLEPPRVLPQRILSPSCLPISPHSHSDNFIITKNYLECNRIVFFLSRGQLKILKHDISSHNLLFLFKLKHRKLRTNEFRICFVDSSVLKVAFLSIHWFMNIYNWTLCFTDTLNTPPKISNPWKFETERRHPDSNWG